GDHGRRADEADGDLRDQRRKLGRAGTSLRRHLSRDVAAPVAAGPPPRAALERGMVTELLRVADLRLSRGERSVLRGVALSIGTGEFCALMGLSGSGKTTVLRAAVALEGFQSGSIDVGG